MGRKIWKETVSQKGPGRKSKKQGDPELPAQLRERDGDVKRVRTEAVGRRVRQRAMKRAASSKAKKFASTEKSARAKKSATKQHHVKMELFKGGSDGEGVLITK